MKRKEKTTGGRKKVLTIVIVCLAVLVVFGVLVLLDYSNSHEVVWLGKYKGLKVSAEGADSPEDALLRVIVQRTKFGNALDDKIDAKYDKTMKYFKDEAEYFKLDFAEYLKTYYQTDEEEFEKTIRSSSEDEAKQEAVLRAVAEKESIRFTEEELEAMLPELMEAYGYTDETLFSRAYNFADLREEQLFKKVTQYLMEQNTIMD